MSTPDASLELHFALIALGSNIDPERNLVEAVSRLSTLGAVVKTSRVYESKPIGYEQQDNFCNAAAMLVTPMQPRALRRALRDIEEALHRQRDPGNKNGPRTIDLDIACYDHLVMDTALLQIPDPEIHTRPFLAVPLAEIAPDEIVPGSGERLSHIAARLTADSLRVRDDLRLDDLRPADRIHGSTCESDSPLSANPSVTPMDLDLQAISLRFCYGHRLLNYDGKCRNLHGHTAKVELRLDSDVTPQQWETHRSAIQQWIDGTLNARMILCHDDPALPAMSRLEEPVHLVETNPTTENIARLIFHQAEALDLPIAQVRMWESPRCSAIYTQPIAVVEP